MKYLKNYFSENYFVVVYLNGGINMITSKQVNNLVKENPSEKPKRRIKTKKRLGKEWTDHAYSWLKENQN